MCFTDLEHVVDTSYSTNPPATEETKEAIEDFRHRCRSSVRINTFQVMEDDEFKKARDEELGTPLP